MKKEHISNALGLLHDDILEETGRVRNGKTKKKYPWGKWVSAAACICLVVVIAVAVSNNIDRNSEPSNREEYTVGGVTLPGGIQPELLVDGTIFYWSKLSQVIPGLAGTYFPKGYTEYGSISSITESEVTEDCQSPPLIVFRLHAGMTFVLFFTVGFLIIIPKDFHHHPCAKPETVYKCLGKIKGQHIKLFVHNALKLLVERTAYFFHELIIVLIVLFLKIAEFLDQGFVMFCRSDLSVI